MKTTKELAIILSKLSKAADAAQDAVNEAEDAVAYIEQATELVEHLSADDLAKEEADSSAIEAARLGLPAMIAKYGHSSKEVQEVEKFISPKP